MTNNPPFNLKQEYIDAYNKDGYVIIPKVFSDEECDTFNRYIRRHANKDFAAIVNPDRYEALEKQDERVKSDITREEIKETSDYARMILAHPKVGYILRALQGKEVMGLSSQFIFKEAYSAYCKQAWRPHQDNFYPKNKNGEYMTMNWFLRDADVENGTIYCYPGSHKLGLLPAENTISFREKVGTNPGSECKIPEEFINKKTDVIIPRNSMVFLHGNCIHGSYSNNSDRSRPWYSCCYISQGEDFIIGGNAKREQIKIK
jgi:ectoine hydroxylase-related dioxygenase (phytanoyl-CoA dioxygenase family)